MVAWAYHTSTDWDFIQEVAIEMGWLEDKVQVKKYPSMDGDYWYTIEPYEENCMCPNLVHRPPQVQNVG